MTLFVVKDGIKNVGTIQDRNGNRILNIDYYLMSYNFKSNNGYLKRTGNKNWKLYTQIGITQSGKGGYFYFKSIEEAIQKLKELKGDENVKIIDSKDLAKYRE